MLPLRRRLQASVDQPPEVERTKNQPRQEGREKRVDGEKKKGENLRLEEEHSGIQFKQ